MLLFYAVKNIQKINQFISKDLTELKGEKEDEVSSSS